VILTKIDYFYFTSKKRYVIYSEGLLQHRGFEDNINKKNLLQDIKSEIRNKRLNKILN
jgi:hypothetical protein